jgi:hypothetical protein
MTDRKTVYRVIDSERDYQEQRWKRPEHNHSNTEYLVYIDHYVKQAFAAVSTQDGDRATLSALRKIAALAVAAMEENGVEYRAEGLGSYEKEINEFLITCKVSRNPHIQNNDCENSQPWNPQKTGIFSVPPYESKPMQKDSPAIGGCVIPTIRSIVSVVPVVPSTTPRNVIADIRESGIDHYVDEPDESYSDENGGRN